MRQLKYYLLLVVPTLLVLGLLGLAGAYEAAGAPWRNLIRGGALSLTSAYVPILATLFLALGIVWVALRSSLRELSLISLCSALLMLGASLVASLFGAYLNPASGIAALFLGFTALVLFRMLTYAYVCRRMVTYGDVCRRSMAPSAVFTALALFRLLQVC
jgi:hypothetical protein